MATDRALREWRSRVAAEYRSAALAAGLLHLAIATGMRPDLLDTAQRVVRDELDHARLSHEVLLALGGADAPAPIDVAALLEPPDPDGPLATLLDRAVRDFCLGETFAVPLFHRMREGATHPLARRALDRVLRDEAVHRAFGWDLLDALLEIDAAAVRARVEARLPHMLEPYRRSYAPEGPSAPVTDEERAVGLIDIEEYRRIYAETVEDLRRRFGRRGIDAP